MGRFNPSTYDPKTDSSPDSEKHRAANPSVNRGVILVVPEGTCHDGCGLQTAKGKRFVQGHDAKMKGVLLRAHLADQPVTLWDGKTKVHTRPALAVAQAMSSDKHDWAAALEKAKQAFANRPAKAPAKKAAKAPAKKAPAKKPTAKKAPAKKAAKKAPAKNAGSPTVDKAVNRALGA